jgi:hypothetical protein
MCNTLQNIFLPPALFDFFLKKQYNNCSINIVWFAEKILKRRIVVNLSDISARPDSAYRVNEVER